MLPKASPSKQARIELPVQAQHTSASRGGKRWALFTRQEVLSLQSKSLVVPEAGGTTTPQSLLKPTNIFSDSVTDHHRFNKNEKTGVVITAEHADVEGDVRVWCGQPRKVPNHLVNSPKLS